MVSGPTMADEDKPQHLTDDIGADHRGEEDEDEMAERFTVQHYNSGVLRDVAVYEPEYPANGPGEDVHERSWERKRCCRR